MKSALKLTVPVLLFLYACTTEVAPAPDKGPGIPKSACDTANITSAYIMTTISAGCTSRGCHKGTGSTASTDFTTVAGLRSYINANEDIFKQRVTSASPDMPPGASKLSPGTRDSINCWIAHNMPD